MKKKLVRFIKRNWPEILITICAPLIFVPISLGVALLVAIGMIAVMIIPTPSEDKEEEEERSESGNDP